MANERMWPNLFQPAARPRQWVMSVITLRDSAINKPGHLAHPAKHSVVLPAPLLCEQFEPQPHFSRLFKCTSGAPIHAFVMQRRLEMAAQPILEIDACLTDIALKGGFADQARFCRRFCDSTGETPAAWRRARGSNEALEHRGRDLNSSLCLAH